MLSNLQLLNNKKQVFKKYKYNYQDSLVASMIHYILMSKEYKIEN